MKYAKYLARQSIPEWQNHYFKYKKLKKELKLLVKIQDSNPAKLPEAQQEYVDQLYEELENVNQFFEAKEKELMAQYEQLKNFLADSWRKAPSRRSLISFSTISKLRDKKKKRNTVIFKTEDFPQPDVDQKTKNKLERRTSLPQLSSNTATAKTKKEKEKDRVSFQIPNNNTKNDNDNDNDNDNNNNNNINNEKQTNRRHTIAAQNSPMLSKNSSPILSIKKFSPSDISPPDSPTNSPPDSPLIPSKDSAKEPLTPSMPPLSLSPSFPSSSSSIPSPSLSSSASQTGIKREPIRDSEMPQPYMPHDSDDTDETHQRVTLSKRFRFAIKRSLEEVHRGLSMLKDFSSLNSVGFRKIIKKHDKVSGFPTLSYFLEHEVYTSHFHTSEVPANLLKEVETVYANMFTRGNVRQATDKLQVPNTEAAQDWVSFRFGMFVGACLILVFYLLGQSPSVPTNHPYSQNILYAYRFMGIPVLWLWSFATVMVIWHHVRINYVFIFGWNPRKHITPQNLFEIAAALSLLWLLSFAGYYNCVLGNHPWNKVPDAVYPFVLIVVVMTIMCFPVNAFYRSSRWWMFQTMLRIVRTPLLPVKFKDFFYTNQFSSLKYAFSDMGDTIYFFTVALWRDENAQSVQHWTESALVYRPILQAYPSFLRFLQCLRRYKDSKDNRHMTNAGKYAMSVLTVIFSGIRKAFPESTAILVIYCFIASVSTIYSWCWDVLMDWDLGYRNCKTRLRPKLMYSKPWLYYAAIVLDLIFRGVWAVTLGTSTPSVSFSPYPMNTIASVTEIIRRFIWNIFRLENEHLKNCHHSNAIALPTLLEQYKSVGQAKTYHMKDYEEDEIEGEGEDIVIEGNEQEMLDKATGIRHRRIGINSEAEND